MKQILMTSIVALGLTQSSIAGVNMANYSKLHPAGFGLQIAGGGLDLAYYTANHDYVVGVGGVTYASEKTDSYTVNADDTVALEQTKEVGFTPTVFVRKNLPMTDNASIGFGGMIGKTIPTSGDTRKIKKSYKGYPYISFEYALSSKFFVYGSIKPVKFSYEKTTDGDTEGKNTNNISLIAGGSVQLTYLI